MANRKEENGLSIDLDSSELLIMKGVSEADALSSDQLMAGMQHGTKVSVKPVAPAAPLLR